MTEPRTSKSNLGEVAAMNVSQTGTIGAAGIDGVGPGDPGGPGGPGEDVFITVIGPVRN